jgi:hypothetical protein
MRTVGGTAKLASGARPARLGFTRHLNPSTFRRAVLVVQMNSDVCIRDPSSLSPRRASLCNVKAIQIRSSKAPEYRS